jgi:hypothetical protein
VLLEPLGTKELGPQWFLVVLLETTGTGVQHVSEGGQHRGGIPAACEQV